jgi:integrase
MPKIALTDLSVRALQAPAKGQTTVWDKNSPVGVRVSQGGAKTFIIMTGSGKRETVGRFGVITLAQAREAARTRLAEKTLGIVKPRASSTFDDAKTQYLTECAAKNRAATIASYKRLLGHLSFGSTRLNEVLSEDIVDKLDKLNDRPVEKHHAIVAGRVFFNWCIRKHYLDRSPMERMRPGTAGKSRERVLSDRELGVVFKTALEGDSHFHRIVALLTLTGQRRTEVAKFEWDWINGQDKTLTLPSTLTKNKRPHTFPVGDLARRVIAGIPRLSDRYLFPSAREQVRGKPSTTFNGWGKPKAAFDKELRSRVAPWTLHDLRRTLSSGMAALGVPQPVVEKLLNHVSGGVQSPIAAVYNRYGYMSEMRDAVAKWEAKLTGLAERSP